MGRQKGKGSYPSWRYKSEKTYAIKKLKDWDNFYSAICKLQYGCAWLPKKVRDLIDPVALDAANTAMENYVTRVKKRS